MAAQFGSRDSNCQFARKLARRWFTTRPPPISNSCTYAKLRPVRVAINRLMNSLSTDTGATEKHANFHDIATAGLSQEHHERKG